MSNRREDAYSRPNRSGVLAAAALMLLALLVGVLVLNKVGKAPSVATASSASASTPTNPGDTGVPTSDAVVDSGAIDPTAINGAVTTLPPRAPSLVNVLVVNGTKTAKVGAKTSTFLATNGWKMVEPPKDAAQKDHFDDAVFYQPGFNNEAQQIAVQLGVIARATGTNDLTQTYPIGTDQLVAPPVPAFDILVMVGPGLAQRVRTTAATSAPAPAVQ